MWARWQCDRGKLEWPHFWALQELRLALAQAASVARRQARAFGAEMEVALARFTGFEKSQGSPSSGSTLVKSSAQPAFMPMALAILVTRGGGVNFTHVALDGPLRDGPASAPIVR